VLIDTPELLRDLLHVLEVSRFLSVDVETTGLDYIDSEVIGIGFADVAGQWYVTCLDWEMMAPLFDLTKHILISHNTPFDMYFIDRECRMFGVEHDFLGLSLHWWDTLGMAALADENLIGVRIALGDQQNKHGVLGLKALSKVFLGREQRPWDATYPDWPPEQQADYCCADVRNTYDLAMYFKAYLESIDLLGYYQKYVAPMSFVTMRMESLGIKVDTPALLTVQAQVQEEIDALRATIAEIMPQQGTAYIDLAAFTGTKEEMQQQLASVVSHSKTPEEYLMRGSLVTTSKTKLLKLYEETSKFAFWKKVLAYTFKPGNPASYQQLAEYFVGKGYRLPMTGSGNYSVALETLEALAVQHPNDAMWGPLFKMRKLEKLQSTYVTALLEMAWEDGSVHPEWNQSGTATGRYSTSSSGENKNLRNKRGPALQTIPRADTLEESGWTYNPRAWFVARPGYTLCVSDLSQAEVRMLAVMSGDATLADAIKAGDDLHSSVAEKLWGKAFTEAAPEARKVMRSNAKQVTFGTIYGIGPNNLSERLGISGDDARELLDDFYATFPHVSEWKREQTEKLSRLGYVTSLLGRRRSPILVQPAPRVTAAAGTPEYDRQTLQVKLWETEWDFACKKSGFDPSTVEDNEIKGRAQRQAINFMVQGSVAELVNYGLWRLVRAGYRVVAQIHDELLVEVRDTVEDRLELENLLREVYEVTIRGVPFRLDLAFGYSWGEGKG
jgi:DNA polymerase I-like protein with 3'-5' exonuclease and polymerase domains